MPLQRTQPKPDKYSSVGDYLSAHLGHLRWARKAPAPQIAAAVTDAYQNGRLDDGRKLTNIFLHKATPADALAAVSVANANTLVRNVGPALRAYALCMGAGVLTQPQDLQGYCYALIIANRPREAIRIMEKAAIDRPGNALLAGELANIHLLLGLAASPERRDLAAGNITRAREWYNYANHCAPNDQTILQNWAVAVACAVGPTYDKTGEHVPVPHLGRVTPIKHYVMDALQRNARYVVAGPVVVPHWYPNPNGIGGFMGTSIMIQGRPYDRPENLRQLEALRTV
jgi:hypothetical protein